MKVTEIDNFEKPTIARLANERPQVAIIYSVAWDPLGLLAKGWMEQFLHRFYGFEPQATSAEIARMLHMHQAARWTEAGQWMEVLEADRR